MKKRTYHYFFENDLHEADDSITIDGKGTLQYKTIPIECIDRFDGDLALFAFPIKYIAIS